MHFNKYNLTPIASMIMLFLCLGYSNTALAQEKKQKIVIIKKTIDKDGNEFVERIEKEGETSEDVNIDKLLKEHVGDDVDINIESNSDGKEVISKRVKVIKKKVVDENGEVSIDVDVQVDEDYGENENEKKIEEKIIRLKKGEEGDHQWIEKDGDIIILDSDDEDVKIIQDGDKTIIKKEKIIIKSGDELNEKEIEQLLKEKGIKLEKGGNGEKTIIIQKKNQTIDEDKKAYFFKRGLKSDFDSNKKIILSNGPRPTLGIYMNASRSGKGALVSGIIKGSAAEKVGMQKGDIVLNIDQEEIRDHQHLADVIGAKKAEDQIVLTILRGSETLTLKPVLQKGKPVRQFYHLGQGDRKPKWMRDWESKCDEAARKPAKCRRIKVEQVPWLGVEIENNAPISGVIVTKVFEDTAAEKMGLQEGDIIQNINRTDLSHIDELVDFIRQQRVGMKIKLKIRRGDGKEKLKGRLGEREKRSVVWEDCDMNKLVEKAKNLAAQKKEAPQSIDASRDLDLRSFGLFPNPTAGNFKLKFDSERSTPVEIKIVDITGKTVYREFIQDFVGNYHEEISIEDNPSGTYILQITQDGQVFNKKIILNRNF